MVFNKIGAPKIKVNGVHISFLPLALPNNRCALPFGKKTGSDSK